MWWWGGSTLRLEEEVWMTTSCQELTRVQMEPRVVLTRLNLEDWRMWRCWTQCQETTTPWSPSEGQSNNQTKQIKHWHHTCLQLFVNPAWKCQCLRRDQLSILLNQLIGHLVCTSLASISTFIHLKQQLAGSENISCIPTFQASCCWRYLRYNYSNNWETGENIILLLKQDWNAERDLYYSSMQHHFVLQQLFSRMNPIILGRGNSRFVIFVKIRIIWCFAEAYLSRSPTEDSRKMQNKKFVWGKEKNKSTHLNIYNIKIPVLLYPQTF